MGGVKKVLRFSYDDYNILKIPKISLKSASLLKRVMIFRREGNALGLVSTVLSQGSWIICKVQGGCSLGIFGPIVEQCLAQCLRYAKSHEVDKLMNVWILSSIEVALKPIHPSSSGWGWRYLRPRLGDETKVIFCLGAHDSQWYYLHVQLCMWVKPDIWAMLPCL